MRVYHEIYGPGTEIGASQFPEFVRVRFDRLPGCKVQTLTVGVCALTPLDEPDVPSPYADLDIDLQL